MLIALRQIKSTKVIGLDENIGPISDLYLDADSWGIRYFVVQLGNWLHDRKVLLPPSLFAETNWGQGTALVALTKQQVQDSPDIDTDRPVSRQMEAELIRHYDIPAYWGPAGAALAGGGPVSVPVKTQVPVDQQRTLEDHMPNLRSANEVIDYYVHARDGDLGHVEEFIIDDQEWVIRYLVVDTKNWMPARKVLISPQGVDSISWSDATVDVNLTRDEIKGAPDYDPITPVNRVFEEHLYDYYGRDRYWFP